MSRRDEQQSYAVPKGTYREEHVNIVVKTDKIAIVDTDILFHWALSFVDDHMTLEQAKIEAEKVLINFEHTLQAKAYVYFIKGKGNFRYTVATMKSYKGTRVSEPHRYYQELLDHMIKFRNCYQCHQLEADDMISIFHDHRTVACTNDKDAKQTAGDLYNFTKKEIVTISEDEAWKNLWLQVITGDSVDNIPGIEGVGPAKALDILTDDIPLSDYPNEVLKAYISKYGLQDGSDFFNENYQLIRMKSSSGKFIKQKYKELFLLIDYLHEL